MAIVALTAMYIMLLMAVLAVLVIILPIAIALGIIAGSGLWIAEGRRIRTIVAESRSVHRSSYIPKNTESGTDRRFH
jgi:hypothetical protein